MKNLEVGKFYWMLPHNDPDGEDWENEPQPARYEGGDNWTCLGVEGVSDWVASGDLELIGDDNEKFRLA